MKTTTIAAFLDAAQGRDAKDKAPQADDAERAAEAPEKPAAKAAAPRTDRQPDPASAQTAPSPPQPDRTPPAPEVNQTPAPEAPAAPPREPVATSPAPRSVPEASPVSAPASAPTPDPASDPAPYRLSDRVPEVPARPTPEPAAAPAAMAPAFAAASPTPVPATFASYMLTRMADDIVLPSSLLHSFNWLEAQGWLTSGRTQDDLILNLYPKDELDIPSTSLVCFGGEVLPYTGHWAKPDPSIDNRINEIAKTSGDGATAAIWQDDTGAQWFVHLGHDTCGVITKDPITFLQFLAMGYCEPGALPRTDITPVEDMMLSYGVDSPAALEAEGSGLPLPPHGFRQYLETTFGAAFPQTAADLGIANFTTYGTANVDDPFVTWLNAVTPPASKEELDYVKDLHDMATSITLDEAEAAPSTGLWGKVKGIFGGKNQDQ